MSGTTGTVPLQTVVADQLITAALWNAEFGNVSTLLDASGCGGHSGTDADTQIQTAPYPGSVLSKATSIAGELERLRYQFAQILGTDYWYKPAATNLTSVGNVVVPVGGVIDYPVATAPSASWHLADGTAISRAGYPALFALIGTTFGVGNGTTTFNLPDYRDRMSIGAGTTYAAAATGGAVTSTVAITDPGHNHTQNSHTHTMGNHTHSTPAHQHVLDYGSVVNQLFVMGGEIFSTDSDGAPLSDSLTASGGAHLNRHGTTNQTKSGGGGGTSGTPSTNTSDATTPTNNSNTTGITATNPNLPPYLGMYKLIRVL